MTGEMAEDLMLQFGLSLSAEEYPFAKYSDFVGTFASIRPQPLS